MLYQILSKRRVLGRKIAVAGTYRSLTYEKLHREVRDLAVYLRAEEEIVPKSFATVESLVRFIENRLKANQGRP